MSRLREKKSASAMPIVDVGTLGGGNLGPWGTIIIVNEKNPEEIQGAVDCIYREDDVLAKAARSGRCWIRRHQNDTGH